MKEADAASARKLSSLHAEATTVVERTQQDGQQQLLAIGQHVRNTRYN